MDKERGGVETNTLSAEKGCRVYTLGGGDQFFMANVMASTTKDQILVMGSIPWHRKVTGS